jgi:hypothetical protein
MTTMTYADLDRAIQDGAAAHELPERSRAVLMDILQGRLPLAAVRHPLGFFCLPVVRDGDLGVCVHVWTTALPMTEATTSAVHCHSWDLVSFVLYGRIAHTLLDVVDDEDGPERVFEVVSRGDVDELAPTPRTVSCARRARRVTGPNASYRLRAGQFHFSVADDEPEAATVVLGLTRGSADLTIGARQTPAHRIRRQRCSAAETADLARLVIEELDKVRGGD